VIEATFGTVWRTIVSFGMSSEALGNKFDRKTAARAFHRRSPTFRFSPDVLEEDLALECAEQENGASRHGRYHSPIDSRASTRESIPAGLALANRAQGQPRGKAMQKLRDLVRSLTVKIFEHAKSVPLWLKFSKFRSVN
jgi:hypothetical protein